MKSGIYGESLIVFGGRIRVAPYVDRIDKENEKNVLCVGLSEFDEDQEIGKTFTEDAGKVFDDKVLLVFNNEKSIDVLIEQLQELKKINSEYNLIEK